MRKASTEFLCSSACVQLVTELTPPVAVCLFLSRSPIFLWQRFLTEGTCPLQGTFPILAGDITPSAVMKKNQSIFAIQ